MKRNSVRQGPSKNIAVTAGANSISDYKRLNSQGKEPSHQVSMSNSKTAGPLQDAYYNTVQERHKYTADKPGADAEGRYV